MASEKEKHGYNQYDTPSNAETPPKKQRDDSALKNYLGKTAVKGDKNKK